MAQIKYVVFACLIFIICWIIFTGFLRVSNLPLTSENHSGPIPKQSLDLSSTPRALKGKDLYIQNCQSCHPINVVCGYQINHIDQLGPWGDKEKFKNFVRNPETYIPTTEYTRMLQKQFDQVMPGFSQLSDEEMECLYFYLQHPKQTSK